MSVQMLSAAWAQDGLTSNQKLVLLGLANWCNSESQTAWPSIPVLAERCSLTPRSVQRIIKQLRDLGLISVEQRSNTSSVYYFHLKERHDVIPDTVSPLTQCHPTPDTVSPNTRYILKDRDTRTRDWPDWLPLDAWVGFVNMRNATKKPMTDRAVQNLLTKLEKMRAAGQDVAEVLDQSTNACWADVYEVKERRNGKQRKQVSGTATAAQRAIDHYEARNH